MWLLRRTVVSVYARAVRRLASSSSWIDGIPRDEARNVPQNIIDKVGKNLHNMQNHPISILKQLIAGHMAKGVEYTSLANTLVRAPALKLFDSFSPVVSTKDNFDEVLVPADHISRSPNDTYYLNKNTVLRTHTSAHQVPLLRSGERAFLVAGDVYRRDSIDASHYPVFHQMEGLRVLEETATKQDAAHELRELLDGLVRVLFNDDTLQTRWVDTEFPFTTPSWEMEVFYRGDWLEVLGCGVVHPRVLTNADKTLDGRAAWAFGLGLERIAMVLFGIPDIRLFWSTDLRFINQFQEGKVTRFEPYSRMPPCWKDISMWVGPNFHYNSLCEVVRTIAGDLVESVELKDNFANPKTGKVSHMYRITYRAHDRSLTNEEIDALQQKVRETVSSTLDATLR